MHNVTEPTAGDFEDGAGDDAVESPLAIAQAELATAKAEQMRLLAEMDNQRKRAARDVDGARKFGVEKLLNDLMPVVDGLEMGISQGGTDPVRLLEGMDMTLRLLLKATEQHGLKRLDPVGEAFNPEWHQAMAMVPSRDKAAGTIIDVYQRGYRLH